MRRAQLTNDRCTVTSRYAPSQCRERPCLPQNYHPINVAGDAHHSLAHLRGRRWGWRKTVQLIFARVKQFVVGDVIWAKFPAISALDLDVATFVLSPLGRQARLAGVAAPLLKLGPPPP